MKLIDRYLITVYVIPEQVENIIEAIKKVHSLKYGNYKWVYFVSAVGMEFYNVLPKAGKNIPEETVHSNKTCKIEFSIPPKQAQLQTVLESIHAAHPWEEPVVRVFEIKETRASQAHSNNLKKPTVSYQLIIFNKKP